MIQLLISVKSAEEVPLALAGGADLIDVKDPAAGPLASTGATIWREVAKVTPEEIPLSVALGELNGYEQPSSPALGLYTYAKIGLANLSQLPEWRTAWKAAWSELPEHLKKVAVAYADYASANSLPPREILKAAKQARCQVFLIDTFQKNKDTFDHLPVSELRKLFQEARDLKLVPALAGSLRLGRIGEIMEADPQIVAVRGGACEHGQRGGTISTELVRFWKTRLAQRQHGPVAKV